jgi:hypothetical protein
MNSNRSRRIAVTLGAAAGGLLGAAFLPMAVAAADEYVYLPDSSTFVAEPPSVTGFTPISLPPFFQSETGIESFNVYDATTNTVVSPDSMGGTMLLTQFGGGAAEEILHETGFNPSAVGVLQPPSQILLSLLPGGWGSELVFSSTVPLGLEDIVITPFGDFTF